MACENSSVNDYRDLYMRKEDVDGLELTAPSQPGDLHSKLKDLCSARGYATLLSREFVGVVSDPQKKNDSVRVMSWNILAQGTA